MGGICSDSCTSCNELNSRYILNLPPPPPPPLLAAALSWCVPPSLSLSGQSMVYGAVYYTMWSYPLTSRTRVLKYVMCWAPTRVLDKGASWHQRSRPSPVSVMTVCVDKTLATYWLFLGPGVAQLQAPGKASGWPRSAWFQLFRQHACVSQGRAGYAQTFARLAMN